VLIVQLRPADLAVVLVRALAFFNDADASSVLPNATAVALDEQSASIVALRIDAAEGFTEWRSGVFLLVADAARNVLLITCIFVDILGRFRHLLFFGLRALAATRWLAHVLARQRTWRRGLLRAGASFDTAVLLAGGK